MKKILFILMITVLFTTGCTETVSTDTEGNQKKEFSINETAIVNNTKIKINSVKKIEKECSWEWQGKCQSYTKPDNDYFMLIDLTIENNGTEEISVSSLLQFDLKNSSGERAKQEYMLNSVKNQLDGELMANDILKGQIAFDVTDDEYYYFYYQDNLLSSNIKFIINKSDIIK